MATALLFAIAFAAAFAGCSKAPAARPDVALIVIDTLRADRLGAYGYARPTSPTIDRLAAEGLVYEHASATAPFTMPSVAALMTGRFADRVGVHSHSAKDRLTTESKTIAELAGDVGYFTAAVVSNPWLARRESGFEQGFDHYLTRHDEPRSKQRLGARAIVDRALALLDDAADDRPAFVWTHFLDPHMPYAPPPEIAARFGNDAATSRVIADFNAADADRQSIYFQPAQPVYDDSELDATKRLYDASIRHVDDEIARLLDGWTKRRGRPRITIVVSDHGESLGDHGLFFAHDFTLFEELLHVPLIIHGTESEAARIEDNVSLVDLFPTLCTLMQAPCPEGLDGFPLPVANMENMESSGSMGSMGSSGSATNHERNARTVYAAGPPKRARYDRDPFIKMPGLAGRWSMAKQGNSKLIHIPEPGGATRLLFDLKQSPGEVNTVHETANSAKLMRMLDDWRERMSAASLGLPAAGNVGLDPATREELRQLGYLD